MIEVDLASDLVMFVQNGRLEYVLNTSTGGGYSYSDGNETAVAITPVGLFHIYRQVDGTVTDSLGQLWRPKFFEGGFALHGDSYVPVVPGVPRLRAGKQRGHRLDLGRKPGPDRHDNLGVLRTERCFGGQAPWARNGRLRTGAIPGA